VVAVVEKIAETIARVTVQVTGLAIEMSNFKDTSIASLTALEGSSAAAGALYEKIQGIAEITGEGPPLPWAA